SQSLYFREDLGLELRCVALTDRSGVAVAEHGFDADALQALAQRKQGGARLKARRGSLTIGRMAEELRRRVYALPAQRAVLVDLTAEDTLPLLREAVRHRFHVVLANKKPLAAPQDAFDALFAEARAQGV